MAHLYVQDLEKVRVLRFSNVDKRNALTREMLAALKAALAFDDDNQVRCVVLAGDEEGKAFSSGFDITAIDEEERARGLDPIDEAAVAIEGCAVPVVAAIEGPMFGGAFELAMACDLRFMGELSTCGMPPARLGLVYSYSGLKRFLRVLSPSRCQRLFLSAAPLTAPQALAFGIVDEVVSQGASLTHALAFAKQVCFGAPIAVRGMCEGIRLLSRDDDDASESIAAARGLSLKSEDLKEGVRAFQERRPPAFRGR
ncbi:MAG: enoyl-CoA hydratase [Deltaproteobacteria bacterium]|nr:enoyl-CoA hydratase [Deltaproteobacteria bacterium]